MESCGEGRDVSSRVKEKCREDVGVEEGNVGSTRWHKAAVSTEGLASQEGQRGVDERCGKWDCK